MAAIGYSPGVRILTLLCLLSGLAGAHGINGHVHVTGWAIESLPPGSLKDFFAEKEVFEAALLGAAFPDSGYAVDHAYGELAHWPPFTHALLELIRRDLGPPFPDLETCKTAAFLMGIASHGLQDELFDSVFLHQVSAHDGGGQDEADPGTDGFLIVDGHHRFKPAFFLPGDVLRTAFDEAHGLDVPVAEMDLGLRRVKGFVIDVAEALGPRLDADYRHLIPWTAEHYLDANIPGSLAAEIPATRAYIEAVWARLHGEWPAAAVVGHAWPDPPRRLLGVTAGNVDSWVTVVFGSGVNVGSLNADTVRLTDEAGAAVAVSVAHTRWSGSRPEASTRLVQLRPDADLRFDHAYTVEIGAGVVLQDGRVLDTPWRYTFRTPCAPEAPCVEPDAGVPEPDAGWHPSDAGGHASDASDAGAADIGGPDESVAASADSGRPLTLDAGPERDPESSTDDACSQGPPTPSPWWAFSIAFGVGRRGRSAGTRRIRSA